MQNTLKKFFNFRLRIMKDCFYGLLRIYLRVNNIIYRIIDTRLFYDFNQNYMLRDFQVKENTFEEIKAKHYNLTSNSSFTYIHSDLIYNSLNLTFSCKQKIIFKK